MKFNPFRVITRSLRNKLLFSLVCVHLLTISSIVWYFYASYGALIETIKDDQLEQLANAYALNAKIPHLQLNEAKNFEQKEAFIVQIWDKDGQLQTSSWPPLAIPLQTAGLHSVNTTGDQWWRVYTRMGGNEGQAKTIQVIHSINFMRKLVFKRVLVAIFPLVIFLPLSFIVLWMVIWRVSRDLKTASLVVASQDTRHISGLAPTRVPDEIVPLVESYNSVLSRLRKAFDSQSHFLQDAAHELRTPITAISLQLENLRQHIAPGEASERFAQLEAGVVRARHLVAQLLSLTRQDGSDISPKMADLALESLLKESIEQLMILADQRGIDIGFTGSGDHHIRGDRSELRSLFDNLIANAMLHTPEGTIVDVVLKESDSHIVVEIIDNGPGMPEEFIPRAFDRFARSAGAEIQGSGLGLTIAQSVALRHGIKVELQNRYANQKVVGLCARVILEKGN